MEAESVMIRVVAIVLLRNETRAKQREISQVAHLVRLNQDV